MRRASLTDAVGRRFPMELIHRMRLRAASRVMMCFLLSGSASQSLQKQMMSCPWITYLLNREGRTDVCSLSHTAVIVLDSALYRREQTSGAPTPRVMDMALSATQTASVLPQCIP